MVEAKVRKWGNSLGVRIPLSIAKDIGLSQDCLVSLEVENGRLIVCPKPKKYALDQLLSQVTAENIHPELDWGTVGKEIW